MKKIYLRKIVQKEQEFYSMVIDPRLITKLRKKYIAGEKQDVQRPWIESKVKDIARYVAGKTEIEGKKALGIIPNAPIINVKGGLKVQVEDVVIECNGVKTSEKQYFIMFPETPEEIAEHENENELEIIDGQHRIIAFGLEDSDLDLNSDMKYEMNFTVFSNLDDKKRKELFMVTNEKQDKVAKNLLNYIKKSLGLLTNDAEEVYELLEAINSESSSPLYERIMFGADKIKKGYQETQLSKIFKNYKVKEFYDNKVSTTYSDPKEALNNFVIIFDNYISAWEELAHVSFKKPENDTMTKISGLRYLLYIFPVICDHLISNKEKLLKENFVEFLKKYPKALGLENIKSVFCDDEVDENSDDDGRLERGLAFRGEGATIALAKSDIQRVLSYVSSEQMGGLL